MKHYNDLADGTIEAPIGHKDWADVIYNAKIRAEAMKERIAHKLTLPKYANEVVKKPITKPVGAK